MKIQITKKGMLEIERDMHMRETLCPYATNLHYEGAGGMVAHKTRRNFCGDWCPLFGEPEYDIAQSIRCKLPSGNIELCHKTIIFSSCTDNRKDE